MANKTLKTIFRIVWVALTVLHLVYAYNDVEPHVVAKWDFDENLEGWAQSTTEEMGAEIYAEAGELHGRIKRTAKPPRFDSPLLSLGINDKYVVGMRIKYGGRMRVKGAVMIRIRSSYTYNVDFQSEPVGFGGPGADIVQVTFDEYVEPNGKYQIVYAPIYKVVYGKIIQLRVIPLTTSETFANAEVDAMEPYSTFEIDWIKLIKIPTIDKVEGCINKYYTVRPYPEKDNLDLRPEDSQLLYRGGSNLGENELQSIERWSNDDKHIFIQTVFQLDSSFRYGTTFNCPRNGPVTRIRIHGRNFGDYEAAEEGSPVWDTVLIDGQPCTDVKMLAVQRIVECSIPTARTESKYDRLTVRIVQPDHRRLFDEKPYFSYAVPAPRPETPLLSNLASRSLDLSWSAPPIYWDAVTITGYKIHIFREIFDAYYHSSVDTQTLDDVVLWKDLVVGNVTTTTIIGLDPATKYMFTISAIVEDQRDQKWTELDLYGRRAILGGALESISSVTTPVVRTLDFDFQFLEFNAASSLDHGATDPRTSVGPSRNEHGEGSYGLLLSGDTHIENCNASSTCCDFDQNGECALMCSNIRFIDPSYVNFEADRQATSNSPNSADSFYIGPVPPSHTIDPSTASCGPSLRLTASGARLSGSNWYRRKMNVREGFETTFTYRISNPSLVCKYMDDVATHCRSRGADGFAFVVQNDNDFALGGAGNNLGYAGIKNAVVVEFDTFFNPEQDDPYENHVSVLTRGWRENVSSSHKFELGGSPSPVDLTDGDIKVRITYTPKFDESVLFSDTFKVTSFSAFFMSGQPIDAKVKEGTVEYSFDQMGHDLSSSFMNRDWYDGVGILSVYVSDMSRPLFSTVLNLASTLKLDSGRAWVGFTGSTGSSHWQAHDILQWDFQSLREDI